MQHYFEELEDIYANRQQYDIEWAYSNAQAKLDEMKKTLCEKTLVEMQAERKESKIIKKNQWYASIFKNLFQLITVLEFLISLGLVLVLSELSHQGAGAMTTKLFSMSVVVVFAFMKVFLEQHFLRPSVEKLGWSMYRKTIIDLKAYSSQQITGMR